MCNRFQRWFECPCGTSSKGKLTKLTVPRDSAGGIFKSNKVDKIDASIARDIRARLSPGSPARECSQCSH